MPDPLLVPSIAMLTGGGLLAARDYLSRRLQGPEDRYMALYGKREWEASNMDLTIHCAPELADHLKAAIAERLPEHLATRPEETRLLREEADLSGRRLLFVERDHVTVDELLQPRHGLYFDMSAPDRVRVVWNHMQTDGVGMWTALRGLFDPNPALVPYREVPSPPPLVPELLALPSVARRLTWRGRLRKSAPRAAPLTRGLAIWDTQRLREKRHQVRGSFNVLTSALVIHEVFTRHPERDRLNVGLTAYFPFLEGRNKYGVFLCKVRRSDVAGTVAQLAKQTSNPMLNWGRSAAQAYALGRMPDPAFARVVAYYRRQIDVLISSLPVGRKPISLAGVPTVISCHPWELTLPYYFLLVGTRSQLHVSYTSRFTQDESFLDLEASLAA